MKSKKLQQIFILNSLSMVLFVVIVQALMCFVLIRYTVNFHVQDLLKSTQILAKNLSSTVIFENKHDFFELISEYDFDENYRYIFIEKANGKKFVDAGAIVEDIKEKLEIKNSNIEFDSIFLKTPIYNGVDELATLYVVHSSSKIKNLIVEQALIVILATLIILFISFYISKRISLRVASPIIALSNSIHNITKYGNKTERIDPELSGQIKEAEILIGSFNALMSDISDTQSKLEGLNKELESRVEEQTYELSSAIENLRKFQKKLVTQEKLASLGSLSAGIAHEIKNPLNLINNSAKFVNDFIENDVSKYLQKVNDGTLTEEEAKYFKEDLEGLVDSCRIIIRNGERADMIIKNMLKQSGSGQSQKILVDFNELLDNAINLAYHSMRANNPMNIELKPELEEIGKILVNESDIERSIINILDNSFYALRLKSENNPSFHPKLDISMTHDNTTLKIIIEDNGIGIASDAIEKIYEPFFTTKPAGVGTGLGLSMVNDIIVSHDGELRVQSEPGTFTKVIIRIPIRRDQK